MVPVFLLEAAQNLCASMMFLSRWELLALLFLCFDHHLCLLERLSHLSSLFRLFAIRLWHNCYMVVAWYLWNYRRRMCFWPDEFYGRASLNISFFSPGHQQRKTTLIIWTLLEFCHLEDRTIWVRDTISKTKAYRYLSMCACALKANITFRQTVILYCWYLAMMHLDHKYTLQSLVGLWIQDSGLVKKLMPRSKDWICRWWILKSTPRLML